MIGVARFLMAAGVASALTVPIASRADTPKGQLVYAFTWSSKQQVTARDSANPAQAYGTPSASTGGNDLTQSSGISHYVGSLDDKGTMTVQFVMQQPDGALVVTISEQGQNVRRAPPAECVVYANTNVLCDPNKTVYTEEYTLLRFLGRPFVDPNQLDASHHWVITQNNGGLDVHADYVVNSNNNGKMQISETRSIRPAAGGSLTTDVQTKIGYDTSQSLPTSVDEYVQQRHDNGVTGTSTTIYQTTLNLVSNSMAKT
jgi:hypothetical protein